MSVIWQCDPVSLFSLKESVCYTPICCVSFLVFLGFCGFFCGFWFVVAYCTQLLSQAMYNLMMATMAETCSC